MMKEVNDFTELYLDDKDKTEIFNAIKGKQGTEDAVLEELEEVLSFHDSVIKELDKVKDTYEGKESTISTLEETLKEFKVQEDIAKELQSSIFPKYLPNNKLIEVATKLISMDETSGDFYDIVEIMSNSVYGVLLADISGHGVSAALITNLAKTLFIRATERYAYPKDVMKYVNDEICNILHQRSYFTAFYTLLDFPNKRIIYSSAGHPYNMRYNSETGEVEKLETKNMVIGIMKGRDFLENSFNFNIGDRIVLYTDGISEARNENKEMFGDDRLSKLIKEHTEIPPKEFIELVEYEVKAFTGRDNFDDDVTLVVIDIKSDKDRDEEADNRKGFVSRRDVDKLIDYCKKSVAVKENHDDPEGMVKDMRRLGSLYMIKGKRDEAFEYLIRSRDLAYKTNNNELIGRANISLANLYYNTNEFEEAFKALDTAYEMFKKDNNEDGIFSYYVTLSTLYSKKGEREKGKENLLKAIEFQKKRKQTKSIKRSFASLYNNLGVYYGEESNLEKESKYFEKSLNIADRYDMLDLKATLMNNLATVNLQEGKIEGAIKYLHKALIAVEEINYDDLLITVLQNLGEVYITLDEYALSMYYLKKGISISEKRNIIDRTAHLKMIRAYEDLNLDKEGTSIIDINEALLIIKELNFDPSYGFMYIPVAMLLYKTDVSALNETDKKHYEELKTNLESDSAEFYFKKALEQNRNKIIQNYLPACYHYAEYLYINDRHKEAYEYFKEAYVLAVKISDKLEQEKILKILNKLNIDKNIIL